ncbi:hypothetical protein [Pseudomonas vanderleydeniana]|uniref:Uncharacterized protein n=1 Tax=Pseudomonas vanderleydeniana TaxID=2745495 RepID=A0A9E6PLE8_9PSED|nr:hypothetical protein [Pseudomonas vanderleydeniana]QXI28610.1 hypothetical protein HU752_001220 [Pseudomonas vanderleydeniana]
MPFGIGNRNVQNILNAPNDLHKCQKKINGLVDGLAHVHNRERIFREQEQRITEHQAIANELKTAIEHYKSHCSRYRKFTSFWKLSENKRPFVRHKDDHIYITPRKGVKIYWAEKYDKIFNKKTTVAPSEKYDGGYNQASAKITKLNEYIGARINSVGKRTDITILEEISNVDIQRKALESNIVSMKKYQDALDETYVQQQKYQDRVEIKKAMTKSAFELFIKPGAVDYINKETSKKPAFPENLKNISHKDLTRLLNDGFSEQVCERTDSYRYETFMSEKEIALYKNRLVDKGSVPINKFLPVDPAPSGRAGANVVLVIEGNPSEAQAGETRYKVFRQGCRYITTSIVDGGDGKTHIHLQQVRSSASGS